MFVAWPGFYGAGIPGREIDLIFESDDVIYAIEIKNTRRPSSRDVINLLEFSKGMNKRVKTYLFYPGEEYLSLGNVKIIPVAGLFRGK